jgi:peptide deformylase
VPEPAIRTRRVVLYGNAALRTKSRVISEVTPAIARMLAELKQTMLETDGLGLAANQIGETIAACALNPSGADVDALPYCLLNPQVIAVEGRVEAEEGCLSLPGLYDFLPRPQLVRASGIDESGRPVEVEATGMLARAILHEIDHLKGVLFIDHLSSPRRAMLATKLAELEQREAQSCA